MQVYSVISQMHTIELGLYPQAQKTLQL